MLFVNIYCKSLIMVLAWKTLHSLCYHQLNLSYLQSILCFCFNVDMQQNNFKCDFSCIFLRPEKSIWYLDVYLVGKGLHTWLNDCNEIDFSYFTDLTRFNMHQSTLLWCTHTHIYIYIVCSWIMDVIVKWMSIKFNIYHLHIRACLLQFWNETV